MDKIWKKVGRQDNHMKESSSSSKSKFSSNNFIRRQSGSNSQAPVNSHEASALKNKVDSSEYFDISEDSFLPSRPHKQRFDEDSKGKQSVNIQFEKESGIHNQKQNSQILIQKKLVYESLHRQIKEEEKDSSTSQKNGQNKGSASEIISKQKEEYIYQVKPRNYKLAQSQEDFRQSQSLRSNESLIMMKKTFFEENQKLKKPTIIEQMFGQVQIVQPDMKIHFEHKSIAAKNSMIRSSRMVQSEAEISRASSGPSIIQRKVQISRSSLESNAEGKDSFLEHRKPQKKNGFQQKNQQVNQRHDFQFQTQQQFIPKSQEESSRTSEVEVIKFDDAKEQEPKQKPNTTESNKKKGIMVRIKSGSRLKESTFFEVDPNLNRSDSFLHTKKKVSEQQEPGIQRLKTSLPERHELNQMNIVQENLLNGLQNYLQTKLQTGLVQESGQSNQQAFKQIKSNQSGQDSEMIDEEEIQQVIDLENEYFQRSYSKEYENQCKQNNKNVRQQIYEPNANQILNKSYNISSINHNTSPQIVLQRTDCLKSSIVSSQLSEGRSERGNGKKKIKLGAGTWKNDSWDFHADPSQIPSKNEDFDRNYSEDDSKHVQSKLKENQNFNNDEIEQEEMHKNGIQDNYSLFGNNKNHPDFSQLKRQGSKSMGKSYLALEYIEPIEESKEEDENYVQNSLQKNKQKSQQQPTNQADFHYQEIQKQKRQPQFSYQNFMNILDENIELKSQLMEYGKQVQSKDQKIHQLTLQNQKLTTDCQALRDQIEQVQHQKEQLMFQKQMVIQNSQLAKLYQNLQNKDTLISEINKENSDLKDQIDLLSVQINLLTKELKEKSLQIHQSQRIQTVSGTRLSASRRQSSHMTGYFQQNTSLNTLTQTRQKNSRVLKQIPTLVPQRNFDSQIHPSEDGSNIDFINLSIMLNLPTNKRLVLNNVQAFAELQQYVFDLEQKITLSQLDFTQKIRQAVQTNELRLKQKFYLQIQEIRSELYTMKVKYDKLKLWVKKYQKDISKKQIKDQPKKQQQIPTAKNQENSNLGQMLKNVSDFQQLFMLFNQFSQMQNQSQNQSNIQNLNHQKTVQFLERQGKKGNHQNSHQGPSLLDTQQLKQKQIMLKRRQEEFQRMTRDIQSQWETVEREKRRCMSPPSNRNEAYSQQNPSHKFQNPTFIVPQGRYNRISDNGASSYKNSASSPFINQNQNYESQLNQKRSQFNKFSSQVEKMDQFESNPKIQDSRSERQLPINNNYNFMRSKSPQTDKRFNSDFDINSTERDLQNNFRPRSPDLHYNYKQQKKHIEFEQPGIRRYEHRKGNTIFQDPKDISFISSKLSKLRNDINMELKSIK